MEWLGELARRIGMLLNRSRFRDDLDAEMQLHIDLRRQQQEERGLGEDDAHAAAKRRFGNAASLKERSHSAWGWSWLESLAQDTTYGVRSMLRSPGITAVALLSLALGIGANSAIFSLMDAVMLRSLPVTDPGRLLLLGLAKDDGITDGFGETDLYSYPVYRRFQQQTHTFSSVAAVFSLPNDAHGLVADRTLQEPIHVRLVSGTYFDTLGVQAFAGRMLTDEDDNSEGNHPVAVASYSWWTRSLSRDPAVLGKQLRIGTAVFSIVGVTPPDFFGTEVGDSPDLWIPLSMAKAVPPHWGSYTDSYTESLYVFGRLKPGVTVEQATTDANLFYQQTFSQLLDGFHGGTPKQTYAARLQKIHLPLTPMATGLSELRREFSKPLTVLMAVVALVLLIACANIANLLLARSTARARELAVRQALGAGRFRIARQLLTESLLLALAGGALGVAFASAASRLLLRMASEGPEPMPLNVSVNTPLLLFSLAVTITTAILFGTVPAFRATRIELTDALNAGRSTSSTSAKNPMAKALVVTQVALSLVLLTSAALFLRSLIMLNQVDTGFNKRNVLLLRTDESSAGYKEDDPRLALLHRQVEEQVCALPGVQAASYSFFTFHEGSWNSPVYVQDFDNYTHVSVQHNIVGAGYFATMQIPIVAGRSFGPHDTAASPKVAVISERMARTMFPSGSPIGRHYGTGGPQHAGEIEVIGVARDVKYDTLDEKATTLDYYPYAQYPGYLNDFEVRYSGDLGAVSSAVQRTIHNIDRNIPIDRITTLEERIASTNTDQRLEAQLCTFFALLAAFLSSIGIYGLMSYLVSRRTSEIGVRMALGAERGDVLWLVMREIALWVLYGIAIGIPVTLEGSRFVSSMLFGLKGNDPASLIAACSLLLTVTVLAGYLPARRASRLDPAMALRRE